VTKKLRQHQEVWQNFPQIGTKIISQILPPSVAVIYEKLVHT